MTKSNVSQIWKWKEKIGNNYLEQTNEWLWTDLTEDKGQNGHLFFPFFCFHIVRPPLPSCFLRVEKFNVFGCEELDSLTSPSGTPTCSSQKHSSAGHFFCQKIMTLRNWNRQRACRNWVAKVSRTTTKPWTKWVEIFVQRSFCFWEWQMTQLSPHFFKDQTAAYAEAKQQILWPGIKHLIKKLHDICKLGHLQRFICFPPVFMFQWLHFSQQDLDHRSMFGKWAKNSWVSRCACPSCACPSIQISKQNNNGLRMLDVKVVHLKLEIANGS